MSVQSVVYVVWYIYFFPHASLSLLSSGTRMQEKDGFKSCLDKVFNHRFIHVIIHVALTVVSIAQTASITTLIEALHSGDTH